MFIQVVCTWLRNLTRLVDRYERYDWYENRKKNGNGGNAHSMIKHAKGKGQRAVQ